MLGIFREEYTEEGVRHIKMSQPNYMEKMQEEFAQHMEPVKSDPAEPFPVKTFLAPTHTDDVNAHLTNLVCLNHYPHSMPSVTKGVRGLMPFVNLDRPGSEPALRTQVFDPT